MHTHACTHTRTHIFSVFLARAHTHTHFCTHIQRPNVSVCKPACAPASQRAVYAPMCRAKQWLRWPTGV